MCTKNDSAPARCAIICRFCGELRRLNIIPLLFLIGRLDEVLNRFLDDFLIMLAEAAVFLDFMQKCCRSTDKSSSVVMPISAHVTHLLHSVYLYYSTNRSKSQVLRTASLPYSQTIMNLLKEKTAHIPVCSLLYHRTMYRPSLLSLHLLSAGSRINSLLSSSDFFIYSLEMSESPSVRSMIASICADAALIRGTIR